MSLPFLLEIGTEEIPDWMIDGALTQFGELFTAFLQEKQLSGSVQRLDATPRRLVLRAEGLPERQLDTSEVVMGPPKSAAFKDGKPTGAALGFAKKMGVAVEALETETTPKGEYLCYTRQVPGQATTDLLAAALPELITRLYFPKTMYWAGKNGPRFIRPIRWIVTLLGEQVVSFELAGIWSGDVTQTHRQLGNGPVQVTIADYEQKLKEGCVILSVQEREQRIQDGIAALLQGKPLRVKEDPKLLHTLAYLTEYPTPILGHFDDQFLSLPEEVLVMVMRHHQRYFGVLNVNGKLAPYFIAITNTSGDPNGTIQRGNERVLKARFKDAQFFYAVDQQKSLNDRLGELANVTFQAKLGSYQAKAYRIRDLARSLAFEVGGASLDAQVDLPALFCKCDLTTEMVKEFTDLQGIIGGIYARAEGHEEETWRAIYEHYKPVGMEDSVPSLRTGQVVALADKLDTLRECFKIGLIPSGSKDPLALRRAGQGVIKIVVEAGFGFTFQELAGRDATLETFLVERANYYFRDVLGFPYDEVNAVLARPSGPADVHNRLIALHEIRPTEDFQKVAIGFKRIRNILKQNVWGGEGIIYNNLLEDGPEQELVKAASEARQSVVSKGSVSDYRRSLLAIASLRPQIDQFFDAVLVNAPDLAVRHNRYLLLHSLLREFSVIADFSEIVTGQPA